MKNLAILVNECKSELDNLNIPYDKDTDYVVNTRAKRRWGRCSMRDGHYTIQISSTLLRDDIENKSTKNTILHEMLHTVDGCMNHGSIWKNYANIVNNTYGYNISRTTSCENLGVTNDMIEHKYACQCEKCGHVIYRDRTSKFVKMPERFTHNDCGGHFVRIK